MKHDIYVMNSFWDGFVFVPMYIFILRVLDRPMLNKDQDRQEDYYGGFLVNRPMTSLGLSSH